MKAKATPAKESITVMIQKVPTPVKRKFRSFCEAHGMTSAQGLTMLVGMIENHLPPVTRNNLQAVER